MPGTPATFSDLFGDDLLVHVDATDATTLFSDAGTTQAGDGDEVLQFNQQDDAFVSDPFTTANGPTLRTDYAGSGLPAIEFDGVGDHLLLPDAGFVVGERFFVLTVGLWLSGTATFWCRGDTSAGWVRAYSSSATTLGLQSNLGGLSSMSGLPASGWRVHAATAHNEQFQIDCLNGSFSRSGNLYSATTSSHITLGALNNGAVSQFGHCAIREFVAIKGTCEWGQVLRASKILRDKWGIADPNAYPTIPEGSGTPSGISSGRITTGGV